MATLTEQPAAMVALLTEMRPAVAPRWQRRIDALLAGDVAAQVQSIVGPICWMRCTPRQQQILVAFQTYANEHGHPPTMQELADTLGVSKVTIFEHVGAMEQRGVILRDKHKARSIELVRA